MHLGRGKRGTRGRAGRRSRVGKRCSCRRDRRCSGAVIAPATLRGTTCWFFSFTSIMFSCQRVQRSVDGNNMEVASSDDAGPALVSDRYGLGLEAQIYLFLYSMWQGGASTNFPRVSRGDTFYLLQISESKGRSRRGPFAPRHRSRFHPRTSAIVKTVNDGGPYRPDVS